MAKDKKDKDKTVEMGTAKKDELVDKTKNDPKPKPETKPSTAFRQVSLTVEWEDEDAVVEVAGDGATLANEELLRSVDNVMSSLGAVLVAAGPPEKAESDKRMECRSPVDSPAGAQAYKAIIRSGLQAARKPSGDKK